LVLVGASEMDEAVRRTIRLDTSAPPPKSQLQGRTLVLEAQTAANRPPPAVAQSGSSRAFFMIGGVKVTAEDAARVNQFMAQGLASFDATDALNNEPLSIRVLPETLEVLHEPIGDVWYEFYLDDIRVVEEPGGRVCISASNVKLVLLCEQARLLSASFGAFKAAASTDV
jgi:hypothetical protein